MRTPSGVSYMLENREVMMRLAPDLFADHRVAPVEDYPDTLLADAALRRAARPRHEPAMALLTPGPFNSAYYEHSFLADKLGVELVEGATSSSRTTSSTCARRRAAARRRPLPPASTTTSSIPLPSTPTSDAGRARADARLSRRQRHDRQRGRHRHCRRQGDLHLHAGDHRFYLGEKPLLKNVPTWRCREPDALRYVLDHLAELVVKEVNGSGGYGMLVGPHASAERDRSLRRQADARPRQFHRAADAGALHLPDLPRRGRRRPPRRSSPVRAVGLERRAGGARRPDPRRADGGLAGGQFEPGRRHQGHLGGGRRSPSGFQTQSQSGRASPGLGRARNPSRRS